MKSRNDQRLAGFGITIVLVAALGGVIALLPEPLPAPAPPANAAPQPGEAQLHARQARQHEVELRFEQAVAMLHAKQYEYAVKALHRVLELSPRLVEAHVNMGYALIGMEDYVAAHDFFETATILRPGQANAYYGMALALEGGGDLQGALGAMRTYIHLSAPDDPYLAKARAALWEWQEKIGGGGVAPDAGREGQAGRG